MSEIKIGIIGLGRFSRLHFQCLKQIPGVKIAAVVDLDPQRASETAAEWNCKGYTDWSEMLAEQQLDAVTVLTPEAYHVEPVIAALQAGCHVFVEKPLALDEASAQEMIRVSETTGKVLTVGHVCRFDSRLISIKEAIQEGRLGKLRSIYARRNNPKKYFPIYRRTDPIYILGIHDIDLLHWFTGSQVEEVYARRSGPGNNEYDLIWSMLKFADGTIAVIENNWLMPDRTPAEQDVRMEIVGETGTAHFQDPDQTLTFWDNAAVTTPASYAWSETYGNISGALLEELKHFYACVRENKTSAILRPEDALSAVRVAKAILQSCDSGLPVKLG
ncbi:Gfo/Idh/MocA family protein [Paenibacillus eucommiae]|uniref:Dehydrogenase n=1 Tax=Paenibacillus eucommiae TaxID=1355755 RepID=A0ABS4IM26_9BACL|nr:Gfo/Idh/MocA family oxidoreductase [Paenibacillus eucommiae]MBP1988558.1 putative dehydrogenase [Paenibacillus eucommiae]